MPDDLEAVWQELRRRFAAREASDIARVAAVAGLVGGEGCLVRRLLAYFGEVQGRDCGHCGPCAGDPVARLTRAHAVVPFSAEELRALHAAHPRALSGPRPLARFCCGISSPALAAAKLARHQRFGAAVETPFAEVLAAAEGALA